MSSAGRTGLKFIRGGSDRPLCRALDCFSRVQEAGSSRVEESSCMAERRNRDENCRSDLSGMGKRYRFEGREAPEPWQAEAWAEDHAANGRGRLVCSEGVGTGKSR